MLAKWWPLSRLQPNGRGSQQKGRTHLLHQPDLRHARLCRSSAPFLTLPRSQPQFVAGPTRENHPLLFEEPIMLGDEGIRKEAPMTSAEYPLTLLLHSKLTVH